MTSWLEQMWAALVAHDPDDRLRRAFENAEVAKRIWWFWWCPPLWFGLVMLGEWDADLYPEEQAA